MSDLEQARGCVRLMALAAWADGRLEGAELVTIQKLAQGLPQLAGVGPTSDIARAAQEELQQRGMEAALAAAAAAIRDRSYKELAFQCCARVMGSDSVFPPEEGDFLGRLQELLGLTIDDMRRLLVLATPGMHGGPPVR
jgi:hypothetical protein